MTVSTLLDILQALPGHCLEWPVMITGIGQGLHVGAIAIIPPTDGGTGGPGSVRLTERWPESPVCVAGCQCPDCTDD